MHVLLRSKHNKINPANWCFHWLIFPGFGGQIDFIRGAAVSLDGEGKPIIACTSTVHRHTPDGKAVEESRIVTNLKPGKRASALI